MSPEPTQVIRRYLDALLAGDLDTIRDSFNIDAVWSMHGDLPLAGPWHGRDQIVDGFLRKLGATLFEPGSQSFEFPTMVAAGDTIALEWRVKARSAAGVEYDNAYCGFFVIRAGRIQEVREYLDTRYAAAALYPGLEQ